MSKDKEESCKHDIAILMVDGKCSRVCMKCNQVIEASKQK